MNCLLGVCWCGVFVGGFVGFVRCCWLVWYLGFGLFFVFWFVVLVSCVVILVCGVGVRLWWRVYCVCGLFVGLLCVCVDCGVFVCGGGFCGCSFCWVLVVVFYVFMLFFFVFFFFWG